MTGAADSPLAISPDALDAGRLLFAGDCAFLTAAARTDQLPDLALPEVAFAGRSNVGKSSLLNALTGRKALARTSQTPGRTRQINFFALDGRLVLVDLPGYGYARAAKREVENWSRLTRHYLRGRRQLRRVCLLIDARHGLKSSDRAVLADLDAAAVSYQIVFTKADKIDGAASAALERHTAAILATHPAAFPECLITSTVTGRGIADLRARLAMLAEAPTHS